MVLESFPANPLGIFEQLTEILGHPKQIPHASPITALGFSAGVVGLAGALTLWQQQGGKIATCFALDGWGMPLVGLPICRLSHDYFTHWSSLPLGAGDVNFYAEPAVDHLSLWASPEEVIGWQVNGWEKGAFQNGHTSSKQPGKKSGNQPITAADFVRQFVTQRL
jgi:hypothetical protein